MGGGQAHQPAAADGAAEESGPPDVPLIMDLARSERERQILRLVLSRQQMGWPFLAPPDCPPTARRRCARRSTTP